MNISKGLQAASLVSLLALGSAFAVACNDDPTPGTADAGPDATPATDGGTDSADAGDPCAFGEPNDTRETAKAVDLNKTYAGLCVSHPDTTDDLLDFFEITAPATDLAGGYVELSLANVSPTGLGDFIVTSEADNQVLVENYTTDPGGSVKAWFTVAPGAKYRIQVGRFGGQGERFSYDLLAKYTATVDAFEPNDTKETAKPITVGTPITASAVAHTANAMLSDDDQNDYYSVTLAAGDAQVKMTNVPDSYLCEVRLYQPSGDIVDQGDNYQTTKGADCTVNVTAIPAGNYLVRVTPFSGIVNAGKDTPETFVTGHYTLAVTQP